LDFDARTRNISPSLPGRTGRHSTCHLMQPLAHSVLPFAGSFTVTVCESMICNDFEKIKIINATDKVLHVAVECNW